MQLQRSTDHDGDALRYVLTGPRGSLELRVTPVLAAVIYPPEPGEAYGDAECVAGERVATLWYAADHDDAVIWAELERYYARYAAAPEPAELPGPLWAAVRQAHAWLEIVTAHGTAAEVAEAHAAHTAALRRVVEANRNR